MDAGHLKEDGFKNPLMVPLPCNTPDEDLIFKGGRIGTI
jgi:hypothetical protein